MNRLEERFKQEALAKGYIILGNGWPDFLIMKGNQVIAVEVKSANDKLRENQVEMLKALEKAGVRCGVYRELQTEPSKTVFLNAEDILIGRELRTQPDFETFWTEGMGHLLSGIKNLKEIGLSNDMIVFHFNRFLANWAKEGFDDDQ